MAKTTIFAIQAIVDGYIRRTLKEKKAVDFSDIKRFVDVSFPGQKINFMSGVRSPIQYLINERVMARDTTDLTKEVYKAI